MMHSGFLRAGWVVLMAGVFGSPVAQAEIYTWIDASGVTNLSNLQPPDGVKVTKVQAALPPEIAAREDAARETARKAEADAAAARIRDLENLLAHSPPPDYRAPAAQPVIQYIVEPQPAPMQLTVETGAPAYGAYDYGCNPSWAGCALSWWPVVVVGAPVFRPSHPIHGRPPMPSPHMLPFGPKLTNVVSPTTGFVPPLTTVVPPVTSFTPSLTNVVAPIPQTFAVPRTFNSSPPGLKRG
jgi:hypothetical protein